jgi:antirestriction protein
MKIYVACLASYNEGSLHGAWIDLEDKTADEIKDEIKAMLEDSPAKIAEEWAIHAYEGFGEITIEENDDLENLVSLVAAITEHGEAYKAYCSYTGKDYASAEDFQNRYHGEYESLEEFAESTCEGIEIPEKLQYFIDWERMGRELCMSDYTNIEADGKHYIFSE